MWRKWAQEIVQRIKNSILCKAEIQGRAEGYCFGYILVVLLVFDSIIWKLNITKQL